MVTWPELLQFGISLIALISLAIQVKGKSNRPNLAVASTLLRG